MRWSRNIGWRQIAIAIVAGLLVAGAADAPPPNPIARLAWLAGDWVSEGNGRWTEEQWSAPRGGLMLGLGRSGKAERAMGFEFMRIAIEPDGAVTFWGAPGGTRSVPFRLIDEGAAAATFANPQHDFPKKITYRREGDMLIATVTGDDPANAQSWTYSRREVPPPVTVAIESKKTGRRRE